MRHSGSFRKGDDPRRPQGMRLHDGMTISALARQRGPECIELWTQAMRDERNPWPVRLRASELIMDRGFGKAVSIIETHSVPIQALSRDELRRIAAGELPRLPVTIDNDTGEVTSTALSTAAESDEDVT